MEELMRSVAQVVVDGFHSGADEDDGLLDCMFELKGDQPKSETP